MKYYKEVDGSVWAFSEDGAQDEFITATMVLMTAEELYLHLNPPPTREQLVAIEDQWRIAEMAVIAEQLLMIEDEDPAAKPGTKAQWTAYRIVLRKWVDGAAFFPDSTKRPVQPA